MTEQKYATELKIYSEKISDVMYDEKFMEQIRSSVESGHIVVFKNAETSKNIENLKRYCFNILCSIGHLLLFDIIMKLVYIQ